MPEITASATFPQVISTAVRDATVSFFANACNAQPVEQPQDHKPDKPTAGIMGLISFFGDQVWSFAIALPEPTAVAVSKSFAGFDIPFDSPDMGDLIGEVANVIAGDIVAKLDMKGVKAQMSLPTIARGHDVELLPPQNASTVKMAFVSPSGSFWFRLVKAPDSSLFGRRPGT